MFETIHLVGVFLVTITVIIIGGVKFGHIFRDAKGEDRFFSIILGTLGAMIIGIAWPVILIFAPLTIAVYHKEISQWIKKSGWIKRTGEE
jgi:hypothetical protein